MKLSKVIDIVNPIFVDNFMELEVRNLAYDSRVVSKDTLFFALKGSRLDGHKFIQDAIGKGANSCIVEEDVAISEVPLIKVRNARESLADISSYFYGFPSNNITVVGITGTNGKTTSSFLIKHILSVAGKKVGLIGTMGSLIGSREIDLPNTTPESLWLQKIIREMVDENIKECIMEVSSHGIKTGRIKNIDFDIGVLTNVTRDHLNFHKTFDDYLSTKISFFSGLKKNGVAVINIDDNNSDKFLNSISADCITYGIEKQADVKGTIEKINSNGINATVDYKGKQYRIFSPLRGRYNIYNILAGFSVAKLLNVDDNDIIEGIKTFNGVEGRGESIENSSGIDCVIDYAHTPDALLNLLKSERELVSGRLICVFGAGGNRDRGKRPEMGYVASRFCDIVIVTSDNPRDEEPMDIINDILDGIDEREKVFVEEDRKKAIGMAVNMAKKGDAIVIAGKGHEKYQEIKGKRFPFSDRKVVEFLLRTKGKDES